MKWFCNRTFGSDKKQDWKVFQPHRLHSKWQILKINENLTSFWPAWLCDHHCVMTTRPLCCDHCVMTSMWRSLCDHCVPTTVWHPLCDNHFVIDHCAAVPRPLCQDHCVMTPLCYDHCVRALCDKIVLLWITEIWHFWLNDYNNIHSSYDENDGLMKLRSWPGV